MLEIVGLTRSWHGLQAGVASLNLAGGHAGYGPLLPGTFALPAPYAYRCPIRHCKGACDCSCLEAGFDLLDQQSVGTLQDVLFSFTPFCSAVPGKGWKGLFPVRPWVLTVVLQHGHFYDMLLVCRKERIM